MDGVEEQPEPEPGLGIKEIYEEATPYILRLQVNTDDANAIKELKRLNSRIREKNESYGDEGKKANRFLINYETLVANFKMASSILGNHCYRAYRNSLIGKVQTVSGE